MLPDTKTPDRVKVSECQKTSVKGKVQMSKSKDHLLCIFFSMCLLRVFMIVQRNSYINLATKGCGDA